MTIESCTNLDFCAWEGRQREGCSKKSFICTVCKKNSREKKKRKIKEKEKRKEKKEKKKKRERERRFLNDKPPKPIFCIVFNSDLKNSFWNLFWMFLWSCFWGIKIGFGWLRRPIFVGWFLAPVFPVPHGNVPISPRL